MAARLRIFVFAAVFCLLPCFNGDEIDDGEPASPGSDVDSDGEEGKEVWEGGVLILTDANFDEIVFNKRKSAILVEFYAPWCGHCKSLAPEYSAAAKKLKTASPHITLAKVDATVEKAVAAKYEVSGYPTLKFFRDGEKYDYDGPREADGIVEWLRKKADPNWKPEPSAVVVLTQSNFTETLESTPLALVEFYAPWCGHCKKLEPEYESAARLLKAYPEPVLLAKVDATAEAELAKEYEVTGYPTLFIFRNGVKYAYKGPRTAKDIAEYLVHQSGDCSELVNTTKQINMRRQDVGKVDIVIVGFFDSKEAVLYKIYLEAGNDIRDDYRFMHTFDSAARKHFGVPPNTIAILYPELFHSKYEPDKRTFSKVDATASEIQDFYKKHEVPLVGQRTHQGTEDRRYKDRRPLLTVYYTVDFSHEYREMTQFWRKKVLEVAKDYPDITFAVADEGEFMNDLKEVGLDDSGEEVNVALYDKRGKYPMTPNDEFSVEELRAFVEKYKKGKLKPFLKSQPVPKKQSGPVTVVVANSFETIVNDADKDVLIEFYAPWCGHCKQLEPIYKELAKKHKSNKKLVIAKMDASANDVPPLYKVEGFPTIYFVPASSKDEPIKMENGDRTVNGMEEFMKPHRSVSLGKDEL